MTSSKVAVFLLSVFTSALPLMLKDSVGIYVIFFLHFLTLVLTFILVKNVFSPQIWFMPIIYLYGFSPFFLNEIGLYSIENYDKILFTHLISFFTLITSLNTFWVFGHNRKLQHEPSLFRFKDVKVFFMFFFASFLLYNLLYLFVFRVSRVDAYLSGIYRFSYIQQWFSVALFLYLLEKKEKKLINYIFWVGFSILSTLITGERDIFIWTSLTIFYFLYKSSTKKFILLTVMPIFSLVVFTLLQNFRNFFVTGQVYSAFENNIPLEILKGEPSTAVANLDYAITYQGLNPLYAINDVLSAFIPKFIFYIEDSIIRFHRLYFPEMLEAGSGRGYSLIGSLLSNEGYITLIFGLIFVAYYLYYVYEKGKNNQIFLIMSVFMIPIFAVAMRGNLNSIIGESIRVFLPIFLFLIATTYFKSLRRV